MLEISVEEWLEELQRLGVRPSSDTEGALTIREMANAARRSVPWIRERVRLAIECGRMALVFSERTSLDGRTMRVPAYRLQKSGKAPTKKKGTGSAI